ncbi:MAG: hypothetical protein B7X04_01660 [Parcubacteria group bacterium 21-54-25]|nr:MAG: hypothetical protein B7X04_01660 [Parcubacteria group bacterium 21-54-25]HQU07631.1 PH domain-containing protein [Candidatus Paceibacterota bacterium]
MEELSLEPEERIVDTIRVHWFVLFVRLFPYVLLALLPFAVLPALHAAVATTPALVPVSTQVARAFTSPWIRMALGSWWIFLWAAAFNTFTLYFLNVWVLTTERIIEIRQPRYFSRRVSSFFLSRIQDVTSDVEGLLGTLLDFGFIHVETAGETEAFEMHGIRHPRGLRTMILREIDDIHRNHAGSADGL